MRLKKIALLTALAVGAALVAVQAAPVKSVKGKTAEVGRYAKCAGAFDRLSLSDDQKAAAKRIFQAHRTEAKSLKESTTLTREEKIERFKSVREAALGEFRKVLSPEQQKKLDTSLARRAEARKASATQVRSKLEWARKELNLSAAQETKIKQILESRKGEFRALKGDTKLTCEQQIAEFRKLKDSVKAEIRSVLNPDQQKRFDAMASQFEKRFAEKMKARRAPAK